MYNAKFFPLKFRILKEFEVRKYSIFLECPYLNLELQLLIDVDGVIQAKKIAKREKYFDNVPLFRNVFLVFTLIITIKAVL